MVKIIIKENEFGFDCYNIKVNGEVASKTGKNEYISNISDTKCNICIYTNNIWSEVNENNCIAKWSIFVYFLDIVFGNAVENLPLYAEYNFSNISIEKDNTINLNSNDFLKVNCDGFKLWSFCSKFQIVFIGLLYISIIAICCFVLVNYSYVMAIVFGILSIILAIFLFNRLFNKRKLYLRQLKKYLVDN